MGLKKFDINFVNDQHEFHPVQVLAGLVVLEITEPIEANRVRLTLQGKALVQWIEGSKETRQDFEDRVTYLNHTISLWGTATEQPPCCHLEFTLSHSLFSCLTVYRRRLS